MAQRSSNPFQLLQLSTDFPALLAIAIGIGIAIFIDNTAIRLIGICVSVLGGVGLFVLLGQRTRDVPPEGLRSIRLQEQPNFRTIVKKEEGAKRLVFDDFTETMIANDPLATKFDSTTPDDSAQKEIPKETVKESQKESQKEPRKEPQKEAPKSSQPTKKLVFDDFSEDMHEIPSQTADTAMQDDSTQSLAEPLAEVVIESAAELVETSHDEVRVATPNEDIPPVHIHAENLSPMPSQTKIPASPASVSEQEPSSLPAESIAPPTNDATTKDTKTDHAIPHTAYTESEHAPQEHIYPASDEISEAIASDTIAVSHDAPVAVSEHIIPDTKSDEISHEESSSNTHKRLMLRVQTHDFSEDSLPADRDEPRLEFDFLLQRVLRVIRSVIPARTVLFAWVNAERAELIIEEKLSDIPESLIESMSIPIGNDVLSQIGVIAKPEILTEINPSAELDLLPYYRTSAQTRSFVGVPVVYDGVVIAVLAADTNEDDAYDQSTVLFLGHFTRLLSGLIHSYNDKYDLMQSARIVTALEKFRSMLHQRATREDICSAALNALHERLPNCFSLAVVCANNQGVWHIPHIHSPSEQQQKLRGILIDLQYSLVGKTILHSHLQEMCSVDGITVRLAEQEARLEQAYFSAIPIVSSTYCYGAFVIEEDAISTLTRQDIRLVEAIADAVGTLLEQQTLRGLLYSHALRDSITGLLNASAFVQRAEEEFSRAKHFDTGISSVMIALDEYSALPLDTDPALEAEVLNHIITIIKKHIREFDIIARYDRRVLSVLCIQKSLQETHITAERIRKDAAMTLLHYQGRQLAATVSIGVAELVQEKSAGAFLDHAQTALVVAQQKTNAVHVYA